MTSPTRWFVLVLILILGGCVLPGRSGWECDDDGDCQTGLECRSVHGDRGYSSICLRPGETVYVGGKGDWLRLIMWPLLGISVAGGLARRWAAARKQRRGDH